MTDPISGTWTTSGGEFLYLKYDGQRSVVGVITAGGRNNLATVKSGTFDPATGAITLEGQARNPRDDSTVAFLLQGALADRQIRMTWTFGSDTGEGTLTRVTLPRVLRGALHGMRHLLERAVQSIAVPAIRALHPRPTKAQNEALMRERGENPVAFVIREVREDEIDALARLHVVTWAATYPEAMRPPTFAIRSWQWREAFQKQDGSWFCYVAESAKGELVGFAKGVRMKNDGGDLNKIYLLWDYHRLGLGRRMLGHVTRQFMAMGITTMYVHAEADNLSCRFYEATGAVNTVDERTGLPNGGSYVWRDLAALSAQCPD